MIIQHRFHIYMSSARWCTIHILRTYFFWPVVRSSWYLGRCKRGHNKLCGGNHRKNININDFLDRGKAWCWNLEWISSCTKKSSCMVHFAIARCPQLNKDQLGIPHYRKYPNFIFTSFLCCRRTMYSSKGQERYPEISLILPSCVSVLPLGRPAAL
jgi:hypothetical protein